MGVRKGAKRIYCKCGEYTYSKYYMDLHLDGRKLFPEEQGLHGIRAE